MDSTSAATNAFLVALARRSTLHQAVGVLMERRRLTPTAAEADIRNRALILAVPAEEVAAGIVRHHGG